MSGTRGVGVLGVLNGFGEDPPALLAGGESVRPLVRGSEGLEVTPLWVEVSVEAEGGKEMTETLTGEAGSGGITLTTFTDHKTLERSEVRGHPRRGRSTHLAPLEVACVSCSISASTNLSLRKLSSSSARLRRLVLGAWWTSSSTARW